MERIVTLYRRAETQRDDVERRRREAEGRLERIAELYKWGDLTREACQAERDRLQAELAGLRGANDWATVLERAAALLRDLPAAWAAANPEQWNDWTRFVFQEIEIKDDRVIAVAPQPDFAPFFIDRL